jgi:AraC-like DNA-binding protein
MDILNDILNTLNLKGAFYFRTDFSAPWSVKVPEYEQAARFHMVVQGQLNVIIDDTEKVTLSAGEMILIPRGSSHILFDTDYDCAPQLETLLEDVNYDGRGVLVLGDGNDTAKTQLVCGHFSFRKGADHPLLRELPKYQIITPGERAANQMLDDIIRLLVRQTYSEYLGAQASIIRLSEVMFIEMLRMNIVESDSLSSSLAAFNDEHIGRALELIHSFPERHWSVDSLASEVGMSRSRFAKRFRELLGIGPMSYLSDWRLQKALARLVGSRQSVQQIAKESGYQSPAAFTRAFTAKFEVSPSKYRQSSA